MAQAWKWHKSFPLLLHWPLHKKTITWPHRSTGEAGKHSPVCLGKGGGFGGHSAVSLLPFIQWKFDGHLTTCRALGPQ